MQYLNEYFEQLGMLPTPFSFMWVLQMLIGYSTFLINIFWGIIVFQLGIFVNVKTLPIDTMYVLLLLRT